MTTSPKGQKGNEYDAENDTENGYQLCNGQLRR